MLAECANRRPLTLERHMTATCGPYIDIQFRSSRGPVKGLHDWSEDDRNDAATEMRRNVLKMMDGVNAGDVASWTSAVDNQALQGGNSGRFSYFRVLLPLVTP